nr:chemosensory protein 1 [Heortia vitessoides]
MSTKYLIVLCCIVAAVVARPSDKYTDKYDNLNLDEILGNKRLLQAYVNCILEKGKCSPEGKELKEHLQEAIETGCSKCTETQEKGAYKAVEFLIKNELETWHLLTDKFDPDGQWRKKYEDRARANGIVIPE